MNAHDTPKNESLSFMAKYGRSTWFYVLALAVLTFAVFSAFFLSAGMLYSSDQMQGLDSKVFLKDAIVKFHQVPFWFSPRLSGMPTIDALFGDMFYPISIVLSAILPVPQAISFKMIFHVFLAGFFFFLLLRRGFDQGPSRLCWRGILHAESGISLPHLSRTRWQDVCDCVGSISGLAD